MPSPLPHSNEPSKHMVGLILALCNFAVMNGFRKRRISVGCPNMGKKSSFNNSFDRCSGPKTTAVVFIHAFQNFPQLILTILERKKNYDHFDRLLFRNLVLKQICSRKKQFKLKMSTATTHSKQFLC